MKGEIAVLQLPGSNCEWETARAVEQAGGIARVVRWNEPAARLESFAGYIIPGGFAYQDRVRAGAVAARLPFVGHVARRAREGAPVLGICNGAQVLVEAGLVPGIRPGGLDIVLGPNRMTGRDGYYSRWVLLGAGPAAERCLFTRGLGKTLLPIPMAHGEGRFTTRDAAIAERLPSFVALTYRLPGGALAEEFPWNPNGSLASAAGITNEAGNVLALMPHPERALLRQQVPAGFADGSGNWTGDAGPGLGVFRSMVCAMEEA